MCVQQNPATFLVANASFSNSTQVMTTGVTSLFDGMNKLLVRDVFNDVASGDIVSTVLSSGKYIPQSVIHVKHSSVVNVCMFRNNCLLEIA